MFQTLPQFSCVVGVYAAGFDFFVADVQNPCCDQTVATLPCIAVNIVRVDGSYERPIHKARFVLCGERSFELHSPGRVVGAREGFGDQAHVGVVIARHVVGVPISDFELLIPCIFGFLIFCVSHLQIKDSVEGYGEGESYENCDSQLDLDRFIGIFWILSSGQVMRHLLFAVGVIRLSRLRPENVWKEMCSCVW